MDRAQREAAREQSRQHLVTDAQQVADTLNAAITLANGRARERLVDATWTAEAVERLLFSPARETGEAQHSEGHGARVPGSYNYPALATTHDVYVYRDRAGNLYLEHNTGRGTCGKSRFGRSGPDAIDTRYLRAYIDPRFAVLTRREQANARRRVRAVRRWWWSLYPAVDRRQRALVARHLTTREDRVDDAHLSHDAHGTLLTILRRGGRYCYCIVRDATHPERVHALPVPPETETCLAGLAWCARMDESQYRQIATHA